LQFVSTIQDNCAIKLHSINCISSTMRRIALFLALFVATSNLFAQSVSSRFSARERGWVTFGIDGGLAYQTADVRTTFDGWGAGMTLGKNLAYRPGGLLSFDIRGRGLFTRSYGTDWRSSTGIQRNQALNGNYNPNANYVLDLSNPLDSSFVFSNYRTGMGELGLEGVLTFNRLRERTGVVFSLFGGIGLDLYRTRINQLDANGQRYNYLGIDRSNGRAAVLADLESLRDNSYESRADGLADSGIGAGLMPGAGFELGYQVAPRFVIGIGHKITFSRTDILDGQRWDNNNDPTVGNDWAHYTNLHLRWDIQRSRRMRGPDVEITDPANSPFISPDPSYFVRARVRHVNSAVDIRVTVNGSPRDFLFKNENLGCNVRLQPGRNEIRVRADNPAGSDEETVIIVWEDRTTFPPTAPPSTPPPGRREPTVRITDPGRSMDTDRDNIYLRAQVQNVNSSRDVRVTVNGTDVRATLAEGVEASVPLVVGRNVIRVDVQNSDGRASDEVVVTRTQRNEPPAPTGRKPVIALTQPRNGSATTPDASYDVKASIDGVDRKEDITYLLNGRESTDFNYDTRSRIFVATVRLDLRNEADVTIKARNRYGDDEASAVIRRSTTNTPPQPANNRPEVTITNPDNGEEVTRTSQGFTAKTRYVSNRNEVSVVLNGSPVRDFDFNDKSNQVTGSVTPREGDNTLTVRVQTAGGSAESTVRFKYRKPLDKPTVTIADPANNSETDRDEITWRATTTNVTAKSEITAQLNGSNIDLDYNSLRGVASGRLRPRDGDNTLTVKVQNSAGSAESTVRFRLKKQQAAPPQVTISSPANGSEARLRETDLQAKVTNVADKSGITVQVNGRAITNFDYAPTSGTVTARVPLNTGDNSIRVAASNASGSDEATVRVRFNDKKPPTVSIVAPRNKSKLEEAAVTLKATVSNVTAAQQVSVTLNGAAVGGVTYSNNEVTVPLTLQSGTNAIVVKVTTPDGTASDESRVVYTPVVVAKPTVVFTTPGKISKPVSTAPYTYKANVKGVSGASDIKVMHNGQAIQKVSYNAKTGEVSFAVTLAPGKNTARIEATNASGTTGTDATVTYNAPAPAAAEPTINEFTASVPTINPMNPNTGRSSVNATLRNVTSRSQISLKVNNTAITNFDYVEATGKLTAVANLQKGSNTITLTLTTEGGTTTETRTVQF
jgi:large repetitive protein